MQRLLEETRLKPDCVACEYEELQKIVTCPAVLELKDKLDRLSIRLTECHNENHILKRNLNLAQHIMGKATEDDVRKLPEIGREMGWKGRMNTILELSKQVWELQTQLEQLEEEKPPATPPEDYSREHLISKRKAFWRMELERRQARDQAVQEISPITVECNELRKKLDTEKTRFKRLHKKVNMLRNELQKKRDKNEEEEGLVRSYRLREDQLVTTQLEVCQFRDALIKAKSRSKDLTKEIDALRNKLIILQEKTKENNQLIEGITGKKKAIQVGIDSVRSAVEQNLIRYTEDLKQVEESSKDLEIVYELIQNLTSEKIHLVRELENLIESILELSREVDECEGSSSILGPEVCIQSQPNSDTEVKNDDGTPDTGINEQVKQEEVQPEEVQPEEVVRDYNSLQIEKMMLECAKYRALIKATKTESDRFAHLTKIQENRLKDIGAQVIETRRLLTQKNTERKCLEKFSCSQQPPLKRKRMLNINKESNAKLRISVQARKDENEFLRCLLKKIVESKIQDTYLYRSFIYDSKNFFEISLQKMKDVSRVLRYKRNESLRKMDTLMRL